MAMIGRRRLDATRPRRIRASIHRSIHCPAAERGQRRDDALRRELFRGGECDQQRLVGANMLEQSALKSFISRKRANVAGNCAGERQKAAHPLIVIGEKHQ